MYSHEVKALKQIIQILKREFGDRIISVYAFGSRVRKTHNKLSDYDLLIIVRDKTPEIEREIIGIIVDEEMKIGLSFSAVIKDIHAFGLEKKYHSPFYENIMKEGVAL
jgi:predicted nucleotidyltransferase